MNKNKFRVVIPVSDKIVISVIGLFSECMCLPMIIFGPDITIRIVCSLPALAGILVVFSYLIFNVIVEEDKIKVKKDFRKKFTISLFEITKVECYSATTHNAVLRYYIEIFADNKKVKVNHNMMNFDKMALYLIKNHDNGMINIGAINETCRIKLRKYSKIHIVKSKDK